MLAVGGRTACQTVNTVTHRLVALEEAEGDIGGIHLVDEGILTGGIFRTERYVVESFGDGIHLFYQCFPCVSTHGHAAIVSTVGKVIVFLKAL